MFRRRCSALALLVVVAACGDRDAPHLSQHLVRPRCPAGPAAISPADGGERYSRERLARRFALALADPRFRASVKSQLDASPVRERGSHFQRFLKREGGRALREVARISRTPQGTIETDAGKSNALEMYFPVPEHRVKWDGGADLLVATALRDGEAPVAFDTGGRRQVFYAGFTGPRPHRCSPSSRSRPTSTRRPRRRRSSAARPAEGQPRPAGLYLTASHFVQDFEGWLEKNAEFEIHILGQSGQTDSLNSYRAPASMPGATTPSTRTTRLEQEGPPLQPAAG